MRFRFGEYELDADAYALRRGGVELPLQRKVFDLLRFLLEQRGRVVTKAELLDALWPDEHVNEGAVPWTVFHARRALGQERGERAPIETVQGRGYRWVAEVEVDGAEPPPSAAAGALPFVGREAVMAQLEARLAQALGGAGGLVLLVGEAGIGKTRCAEELARGAAARGAAVWTGRSVEGLGAPVFWPWIQLLREAQRARPELCESAEALRARLATLEGADPASGAARASPAYPRSPDRFWVMDGVSRFLLDAAAGRGALVLLEDLHWADAATLELLAFLVPELGRSALLVVGTIRPEALERERRRFERLARGALRVELDGLSRADVGRYLAELTRREPSDALCRAVHLASAGIPLFVQETVRALIAEHGADGLEELEPDRLAPAPVTRDVLRARLGALDADSLALLARASVLGASFEVAMLQRLCDAPLEALLRALEHARHAGLIASDGPHRYRFAHELLRSILYDDVPAAERVAVHRRAAERLAELDPSARRDSEIAHHFYRSLPAGDFGRVAAAARRAAEAAARVQAFEDAATYYGWALEAQALEPESKPRERAELKLALGHAERLAGRYEKSRDTLARAVRIAAEHGHADLLLRAARVLRPTHAMSSVPDPLARTALEDVLRIAPPGPHAQRISALSQLACVPPYAYDMKQCGELSAQALELARALGEPAPLREALCARLHALTGPEHVDDALGVAAELLARDDGHEPWTKGEAHLARLGALLYRGDVAAADGALADIERVAREARLPEAIWLHDRLRNQRRLQDGDFAAAEAGLYELGRRAKRMGLGYGYLFTGAQKSALALARLGPDAARALDVPALFAIAAELRPSYRAELVALAAELGDARNAQRMLDEFSAHDFADLPRDIGYLKTLGQLARAAVRLGDRARAERLYALLAPWAAYNTPDSMLLYDGSASHPLALLAAVLDQDERAEAHFEAALELNARLGARPQLARVRCDYAHWLAERRSAKRARAQATAARELAASLGMAWLAERAAALA